MKKRFLIPTMLFPYVIVGLFVLYFAGSQSSERIPKFINTHAGWIGAGLLLFGLLAAVMNIVFICLPKTVDPTRLLGAALLVKCVHMPAYVLIFLFGLLLGMMFFMTFPLILFLIFIDAVFLCLSSMVSLYAIYMALRQNHIGITAPLVITAICQCFFCADVISLFVLYFLTRSKRQVLYGVPS